LRRAPVFGQREHLPAKNVARAIHGLVDDGDVLRQRLLRGLEREVPDALVNHRHLNDEHFFDAVSGPDRANELGQEAFGDHACCGDVGSLEKSFGIGNRANDHSTDGVDVRILGLLRLLHRIARELNRTPRFWQLLVLVAHDLAFPGWCSSDRHIAGPGKGAAHTAVIRRLAPNSVALRENSSETGLSLARHHSSDLTYPFFPLDHGGCGYIIGPAVCH